MIDNVQGQFTRLGTLYKLSLRRYRERHDRAVI